MQIISYVFWTCFAIIFYSYVGYGIILVGLIKIKHLFRSADLKLVEPDIDSLPDVTMVIAAYNEQDVIEAKISNCLSLTYPKEKISFLIITDGSNDRSMNLIARYSQICLLHQPERRGKTAALNRAMKFVHTPIVIFCDANTILNKSAISKIVAHYQNPDTGGVSGEKRILNVNSETTSGTGEGFYWKYESFLKKLDSELYTVTGAAGELFSIRTALWEPLPEDIILDDFVISSRINLKGYRIAYEPLAYAMELPSVSMTEEKKRKVRISAGAFQAMVLLKQLFNVFKHPVLFFQFFSHRFLRWTLTPLSLPIMLISNIILVMITGGYFYEIMIVLQTIFYVFAFSGNYLGAHFEKFKALRICHYILFMNYSVYLGFIRYVRKTQSVTWEKAGRETSQRIEKTLEGML